jgi:hypothetical protein
MAHQFLLTSKRKFKSKNQDVTPTAETEKLNKKTQLRCKKKAADERARILAERKKALEERKKKIIEEREAAKKAKEENSKTN